MSPHGMVFTDIIIIDFMQDGWQLNEEIIKTECAAVGASPGGNGHIFIAKNYALLTNSFVIIRERIQVLNEAYLFTSDNLSIGPLKSCIDNGLIISIPFNSF